jgi:hypothetical protein
MKVASDNRNGDSTIFCPTKMDRVKSTPVTISRSVRNRMVWKSNLQPERNLTSSGDMNILAINDLDPAGSDICAVPRMGCGRTTILDSLSAWLVMGPQDLIPEQIVENGG